MNRETRSSSPPLLPVPSKLTANAEDAWSTSGDHEDMGPPNRYGLRQRIERQGIMSRIGTCARRTIEIVGAIGEGFGVAFLGMPDPTVENLVAPRSVTGSRRATRLASPFPGTGTLTLDGSGITLPVVVTSDGHITVSGRDTRIARGHAA